MKNSKLLIMMISLFVISSSLILSANRGTCYISPDYLTSERNIVDTINLTEGQTIQLSPDIVDLDETIIDYEFGYPFEEDGYWEIDYDSSGMYISDLFINTSFDFYRYFFIVNVAKGNRDPELTVSDIISEENETVYVDYEVYDPDGDELNISFESPFNKEGIWKTEIGDAGIYNSTVSVTDGISEVSKDFSVTLEEKPLPPKIYLNETQYTKEGENFTLNYEIESERDYNVDLSGCMEEKTEYFGYDSSRECTVSLEVSDEYFDLRRDVFIMIEDVNRAPVIESVQLNTENMTYMVNQYEEYSVYEGQSVNLNVDSYDPDGDEVESILNPFGSDFELSYDDSGLYESQIIVSDGLENTTYNFVLNVVDVNRAPVIEVNETYYTKEGEYFSLEPNVYDPDGDDVQITYDGWMEESIRYVDFGQAGNHTVNVIASDGESISEKEITIDVEKTYREPEVRGISVEIIN